MWGRLWKETQSVGFFKGYLLGMLGMVLLPETYF